MWDGDQILFEIRTDGGNVAANTLENDRPVGTEHGSVLYTHGPKLDQPLDIIRMGLYSGSDWGDAYVVHPVADFRGGFIDGTDSDGKRLPCGNGSGKSAFHRIRSAESQAAAGARSSGIGCRS